MLRWVLGIISKVWSMKLKGKLDFIKIKTSALQKPFIREWNDKTNYGLQGNTPKRYVTKDLSKKYKELLKLSNKKINMVKIKQKI